jgi:hypothetical protein
MKPGVVVGGAVARRVEYGGHVWALLQWAMGLRSAGWQVLFLDRLDPAPALRASPRVERFVQVMKQFGFEGSFSLDLGPGEDPVGLPRPEVERVVRGADFLLNIMGYIDDPVVLAAARRSIFLDIDPGFPQMWQALGLCDMFAGHDRFATVGRNVGRADCAVPTCGLDWIPVSPPVVSELWPVVERRGGSFTGVGSWRGPYDPVVYEGRTYGLRVHEFRRFVSVPRTSGLPFEIALDIAPEDSGDLERLQQGGWHVVDPSSVAATPSDYRRYVQESRSEFQVAKNIYVDTCSGWVSERTACYLASGRPALVQDTGLDGDITGKEGLVTFRSPEEAVDGARRVDADWSRHARAARSLAMEHFEARRVLQGLVDAVAA